MWVTIATLTSASVAQADGALRWLDGVDHVLTVGELVIPDVRREVPFGDAGPRWVLSWPIVPVSIALQEYRDSPHGIRLAPFGEPQLRCSGELPGLRFAAGARMTWFRDGLSPSLEGGAVVGDDGAGGFAGVGAGLGSFTEKATLSLVTRFVMTTDERRVDLALDVQFPLGG